MNHSLKNLILIIYMPANPYSRYNHGKSGNRRSYATVSQTRPSNFGGGNAYLYLLESSSPPRPTGYLTPNEVRQINAYKSKSERTRVRNLWTFLENPGLQQALKNSKNNKMTRLSRANVTMNKNNFSTKKSLLHSLRNLFSRRRA